MVLYQVMELILLSRPDFNLQMLQVIEAMNSCRHLRVETDMAAVKPRASIQVSQSLEQ